MTPSTELERVQLTELAAQIQKVSGNSVELPLWTRATLAKQPPPEQQHESALGIEQFDYLKANAVLPGVGGGLSNAVLPGLLTFAVWPATLVGFHFIASALLMANNFIKLVTQGV